jgi:hypothetical protein
VLTWRGLVTYYVLFFIHLDTRRVWIAGITEHSDSAWMEQMGRNVTLESWGFLEERNHQGKGNVLLFPRNEEIIGSRKGRVRCKERLGGLLKYYHREAA